MEIVARILFFISNWNLFLLVPLILGTVGLFGLIGILRRLQRQGAKLPDRQGTVRVLGVVKWLCALLIVAFIPLMGLVFAGIVRPHVADGYLIANYGERAEAKVINKENTNNLHNNRRVERYNVIYRTAAGETIETHFDSWDFNVYPSANSVRYPQPGQSFKIAYLPSFPDTFLILTEEESEYSASEECAAILKDIEQKRNRYEFDKKETKYLGDYMSALGEGIQNKCGEHLMEELRSLGNGTK
jgi:hypothetical protein